MTRAQIFRLTVERCNAAVDRQLEAAEIDLLDQGASAAHIEDELAALRSLFEAHRDREIAAVAQWLAGNANTLH